MMIEFNDQVAQDSQLTMSPSSLRPSCSLLTVLVDRVVNADGTELLRSYIEVSVAMMLVPGRKVVRLQEERAWGRG